MLHQGLAAADASCQRCKLCQTPPHADLASIFISPFSEWPGIACSSVCTERAVWDLQITYQMLITSLYQTVLGMLSTSQDYINSSNTAVSAVKV